MRGPTFLIVPTILTLSLGACETKSPPPLAALVPQVQGAVSENTPAARKAAIRRQIAAVCPRALTDDELDRAAQFVETNRSKGAVWIAGRLLRFHRETKICRGA